MGIHSLQLGTRMLPDLRRGWTTAFGAAKRFCETGADKKTHTENQRQSSTGYFQHGAFSICRFPIHSKLVYKRVLKSVNKK